MISFGKILPLAFLVVVEGSITENLPSATIDLDLPPEQRWVEFVKRGNGTAGKFTKHLDEAIKLVGQAEVNKFLDSQQWDDELMAEFHGILRVIKAKEVTLKHLMMINVGYEFGLHVGCSGVVAAMPNGTVIHGRNLDLGGKFDHTVLNVTFLRGGKPVFMGLTSPGQLGFHTAYRHGAYSIEQNTRKAANGRKDYNDNEWRRQSIRGGKAGGALFMWQLRKIMDQAPDYKTALEMIAHQKFASDQYMVLAGSGPYEGAVVNVDHAMANTPSNHKVETLNRNNWFMAQTNDDRSLPPKDDRRMSVVRAMTTQGRAQMTETTVQKIMQTPPQFQGASTIFTMLVTPQFNTDPIITSGAVEMNVDVFGDQTTKLALVAEPPALRGHSPLKRYARVSRA